MFRAGEVKSIVLWLTPNTPPGTVGVTPIQDTNPGSGAFNPLQWPLMNNITLTYNGEVFSRFDAGSAQLWNLSGDQKALSYNNRVQVYGAGGVPGPAVSYWQECPFAQVMVPYDRQMTLVHGKPRGWACAAAA